MKKLFQRWVLARIWTTFIMLGLSSFVLGVTTLNLFFLAKANLQLLLNHGLIAIMDGAGLQLLQIFASIYISGIAYVVLKACESRMVRWLMDDDKDEKD